MVALDLQRAKGLSNLRTTVFKPEDRGGEGLMLSGFTSGNLDFKGGSEYSALFGSLGRAASDFANTAALALQDVTDVISAAGYADESVKFESIEQTKVNWRNSQRFGLDLNFVIVEVDDTDNTLDAVQKVMRILYPRRIDAFRVSPPLGYRADLTLNLSGRVSGTQGGMAVKIGRWFETPPIFIATNGSVSTSNVVADTGRPLWVQVSLSLTSFYMTPANEVESFFKLDPY